MEPTFQRLAKEYDENAKKVSLMKKANRAWVLNVLFYRAKSLVTRELSSNDPTRMLVPPNATWNQFLPNGCEMVLNI